MVNSPEGHLDLNTSGPVQREEPIVDDLIGKPPPARTLHATAGGTPQQLCLPEGKPALVLFQSTGPVPYVGAEPYGADLRKLQEQVTARPELAGRVLLIAPYDTPAEVAEAATRHKLTLGWTADPDGRTARSCVAERTARGLFVDATGKVIRILSGLDALTEADWKTLLP